MRRHLILLPLLAASALVLATSSAPASTSADPVNCVGYPEPRIFLENQSWWEPQERDAADPDHPGTGKQGHIHVGTCFPLYQELRGDTLHLDINLKLHNMTGHAYYLRIEAYGDHAHNVPRVDWSSDPNKAWHCETVDCEKWVSADFPLSRLRYGGDHQWNVYLIVANSGSSQKQYNISRWHASVDRPLPEPPSGSLVARTRQAARLGTGGDSWFLTTSGGNYARVGLLRSDIPWNEATGELKPISGVWRPRITFEKQQNFLWIDPHLHANPPHKGIVIWEALSRVDTSKQFAIDTRRLTNGRHRLVFGTGNVTREGTHTGVGVIPFLVRNSTGPDGAPPSPPPPPPGHPPLPPPPRGGSSPPPPPPSGPPPPLAPQPREARDTQRPRVGALPGKAQVSERAKLRFSVLDDSLEARVLVTILRKSVQIGMARTAFVRAVGEEAYVLWRVPRRASGSLRFCVQAYDRAGNWSARTCARLKVRKSRR